MPEHFIPMRRADLQARCLAGAPDGAAPVLDALAQVLAAEGQGRLERLKERYHPIDPNRDTAPAPGAAADPEAFGRELSCLLERANFRRIGEQELRRAFESESLLAVRLHTDLSDFRELALYARGRRSRTETVKRWFGLRRREIRVDYAERVLLFVRFQDEAHFAGRRRRPAAVVPGSTQLKLFADVPMADLEMLLPNSDVRMRTLDKAVIGVPALIGIAGLTAKIAVILSFLAGLAYYAGHHLGVRHDPASANLPTELAQFTGILAAGITLYLFINRQVMRYRFARMRFLKTLSDNLYFRNLDNNAGAFHRLIDESVEEEVKEALLAWRFLLDGPADAAGLDARIEGWLRSACAVEADFEVDDALAKLERLGLAARGDDGRWSATAPDAALAALRARWGALLAP